MKKTTMALLSAAVLSCTLCAPAMAEDGYYELYWSDYEDEVYSNKEYKGSFYEFDEIALQMYIPKTFKSVGLTKEDRANGYIAYWTLGNDDSTGIGVVYSDAGISDLEDWALELYDDYDAYVDWYDVNGIEMIAYTLPDSPEVTTLSLATEKGYLMEFSFAPMDDDDFAALATCIMASIQEA